jgi:hypothetical protein
MEDQEATMAVPSGDADRAEASRPVAILTGKCAEVMDTLEGHGKGLHEREVKRSGRTAGKTAENRRGLFHEEVAVLTISSAEPCVDLHVRFLRAVNPDGIRQETVEGMRDSLQVER